MSQSFPGADWMRLAAAALLLAGLEYIFRQLGFSNSMVAALQPGAGIALMMTLIWRVRGAVAAFVAYLILPTLFGDTPAIPDATLRAVVALGAAMAMRTIHRRGSDHSHVLEWASFFGFGVVAPSLIWVGLNSVMQWLAHGAIPEFSSMLLAALGLMLSIQMVVAILANIPEISRVPGLWRQGVGTSLAMMIAFIGFVALLPYISAPGAPGLMLLLGLPVALWIAKQPNSLPGAIVTFAGACPLLWMLITRVGQIDHPQVTQAVLYLFILIVVAQLFHASEQDRLATIAEVTRSRDALEDMVTLRNAEMARMIRQSSEDTAARKRFRALMTEEVTEPLKKVSASLRALSEADRREDHRTRLDTLEGRIDEIAQSTRRITNDPQFRGD